MFTASAQYMINLLPRLDGELVPLPGGRCRYLTRVASLEWFAATTAVHGVPFHVEAPGELAITCQALAARLATAAHDVPDTPTGVEPGSG